MKVSKLKNPLQKKQKSDQKDTVTLSDCPHGFRRIWPKLEKLANRAYRHQIKQTLQSKVVDIDEQPTERICRKKLDKQWRVRSIKENISMKQEKHSYRFAWNLFKTPYQSEKHRLRAIAFFQALLQEKSKQAQLFAHHLQIALKTSPHSERAFSFPRHPAVLHAWLQAFFQDEPIWKHRILKWLHKQQNIYIHPKRKPSSKV